MDLRAARENEFEAVRAFYWALIDEMQGRTDTVGWKKGVYPTDRFLRESIARGELFVLDGASGYDACTVLNSASNEGYEGVSWGTDCPEEAVLVPHALGVRPAVQGQGIGRRTVGDILALARSLGKKTVRLDILKGNTAAEHLYTGMGFRFVREQCMYYPDTGMTAFLLYEYIL